MPRLSLEIRLALWKRKCLATSSGRLTVVEHLEMARFSSMDIDYGELSGQKRMMVFSPAPRMKRRRVMGATNKRSRPSDAGFESFDPRSKRSKRHRSSVDVSIFAAQPRQQTLAQERDERRKQRRRAGTIHLAHCRWQAHCLPPIPQPPQELEQRVNARSERLRRRDQRIQKGVEKRERERREREQLQEQEEVERDYIASEVVESVRLRARGKNARQLLQEFVGGESPISSEDVRKALRRALARFHPDRSRGSLRKHIEREEIYKTLQPVYEQYT